MVGIYLEALDHVERQGYGAASLEMSGCRGGI